MGIQQQRILRVLENGGQLTSLDAWKNLGIARLASRISELRMMGYKIESFRKETTNKFGEPTHHCVYTLKKEKEDE